MKPHHLTTAAMIMGISGAFLFLHIGIISASIACLLLALVATIVFAIVG